MAEEELLKALANPTNQAILNLLTVEPTYPRKISDLLSLSESEVSRRLKQMEGLGLVQGDWAYIGKNVKQYELVADEVRVALGAEGLRVELTTRDKEVRSGVVTPLHARIPATEGFVGREQELETLANGEPVTIVEGLPGIGKTTLVARFAREVTEDPVFWLRFRGVESLNWVLNRLAVFLAQHGEKDLLEDVESADELADRRQRLLDELSRPGYVFVFDDVDRVGDEDVDRFLTDAVEHVREGKLILTSRERPRFNPALDHVQLLHLDGLTDEHVAAFLEHKGIELDQALMPRLRDEVGGHPLALNLLLEAAGHDTEELEALLDRIPEADLETYLLQEVYERLDEDERRVLSRASLFRTSFETEQLSALVDGPVEGPLVRLRRRLLIEESGGAFTLHEVVRNFFANLLDDSTRRELHEKTALRYLGDGTLEGRLEALHHYLAADQRQAVLNLLEENLDLQEFDFIDAGYQNLYLEVLDLFDEAEVADPRRWGLIQDEKGDIWFHRGEPETALEHWDIAQEELAEAGDTEALADLAWKRAMALADTGATKQARAAVEEGLALGPDEKRTRERLQALAEELGG